MKTVEIGRALFWSSGWIENAGTHRHSRKALTTAFYQKESTDRHENNLSFSRVYIFLLDRCRCDCRAARHCLSCALHETKRINHHKIAAQSADYRFSLLRLEHKAKHKHARGLPIFVSLVYVLSQIPWLLFRELCDATAFVRKKYLEISDGGKEALCSRGLVFYDHTSILD